MVEVASSQREASARRRLERLTWLLDDCLRIPGTGWRVGLDFLIGLIPFGGDLFGGLLSLWLVGEALRLGAPRHLILRMLRNVGVEILVGFVPVLGDVFDAYWKANRRNLTLLGGYLDQRLAAQPARAAWHDWALLAAGAGLCIVLLVWLLRLVMGEATA